MLQQVTTFIRKEAVLCIAFLCASLSCLGAALSGSSINPEGLLAAIDWRVIALLFGLMAATAGITESGAMDYAAKRLIAGRHTKRTVCLLLVTIPFFASMFVTNDVALLTFTPLAILALTAAGWQKDTARVIVLQAIAANLGGMVTPIGNPQNLFIFTSYELSAADFFLTLAPFGVLALIVLALACVSFGRSEPSLVLAAPKKTIDAKRFALHAFLFVLSVLAVLRVIPYQALFFIVLALLANLDRSIFAKIDYPLLATFVCFFIFSDNLSHLPTIQSFLAGLMAAHPMLTSLLSSQIISNVPAAVLLSGFTQNWHSLLIGVDIGGLGTPIASLASLIAYRLYLQTPGAKTSRFMKEFGIANALTLALMVGLYAVLFVL